MRSINIAILAQLAGKEEFQKFKQVYSLCSDTKKTALHEQETLKDMVEQLIDNGQLQLNQLDNFFFSYSIPQISKEFDLLKIGDEQVLNIELKSQSIDHKKIEKQLKRNKYYLKHLQRTLFLYAYIMGGQVYTLNEHDALIESSLTDFAHQIINVSASNVDVNIDDLFRPSQFLISPINTPDRFLSGDYFLTDHQQEFKEEILKAIDKNTNNAFGITGSPGTGKTLLLYDIAKTLKEKYKCLIVHCAPLSDGHNYLSSRMKNCQVITPKEYTRFFSSDDTYDVIFFDEFHRAKDDVLVCAKNFLKNTGRYVFFSFDFDQTLSHKEVNRNLLDKLKQIKNMSVCRLSDRIRTNKEISTFVQKMFQPKRNKDKKGGTFPHVKILYSASRKKTESLVTDYTAHGFTFINHTTSLYHKDSFDSFGLLTNLNSHRVIGQEFDKVLVVINELFFYEDGNLNAQVHANPDYIFTQLLYQEVTRTRDELCIIVENNLPVLSQILSLYEFEN